MKLKVAIDGKSYEVEVEAAEEDAPPQTTIRPRSAPPAAPTDRPPPAAGTAGDKVCRSPIAGVVVRVLAEVGKPVAADEPLVVLEAMKMESNITAPAAGTPSRILVKPGDSVKAGQVLVELG